MNYLSLNIAALLSLVLLSPIASIGMETEAYRYKKTVGEKSEEVQWCVQKSQFDQMFYTTAQEKSITKTDKNMSTLRWDKVNTDDNTNLSALRRGEELHIKGVFKGESVDKKVDIDQEPWFQSTSYSLRKFVLSKETSKEFWTIRATTLKPYKLLVEKIGDEQITTSEKSEQAIKVEIRLQGMLSHFWKSHYWFRKSDGVFLRFEGASGPPGAPMAVVEYVSPTQPCTTRIADMSNQRTTYSNRGGI